MSLEAKVRRTIGKYRMLSYGDRVLVAVSGGPDSVALLHLLYDLRGELGLHLEVAHLQHGIRGKEAREDALFVRKIAGGLQVPFHLKEVDIPGMKTEKGKGNLEAMGREERYRFFAAVAEENTISRVATGHTRDDQVETLLMWLLRGCGRRGLGGMSPVHHLVPAKGKTLAPLVIRPLIEVTRGEVISYLADKGVDHRADKSNLDSTPLRNWIRLRLLPQLRERIDSRLDHRLAHLADILREEEKLLELMAGHSLSQVVRGQNLTRIPLLQQGKAMQWRLVRLWLEANLGDLRGIEFHHVEEMVRFIAEGPSQGRLSIPRGWILIKEYETVRLEKRGQRQKPVYYSYTLPEQGELLIPEAGVKIHSSRCLFLPNIHPQDAIEALFDWASLSGPLRVRNFRAGDRFQPLGMKGHKKVKDLFIEKKVPSSVRATLPLLLSGEEILWIPMYGRSRIAKVGPETKEVLKVKLSAVRHQQSAGEFD